MVSHQLCYFNHVMHEMEDFKEKKGQLKNPQTQEIGTLGGKFTKIGTFLNFLYVHYYKQIFANIGTHGKITLFFGQNGTGPIKGTG